MEKNRKRKTGKTLIQLVGGFGVKRVLSYMDRDPEKNIPNILDWIIKVDRTGKYATTPAKTVKKELQEGNSNWGQLLRSLWTDIDDGVRKKIFENFVINSVIVGQKQQEKIREVNHCNVPWAILLDPTSACNLRCIGCWAAEYDNQLNITYDDLDYIIEEGKELGVYFYIFSGGEPLIRKKDIIRLCEKHCDCAFMAFTNGTLIDEDFADAMLKVKNFIPAISVEGFEATTDARRGVGTYQRLIKAMEILKERKLPFGISCCYTSKNVETIGSEAYFDEMIAKGAKFAWLFTYIPVGKDAVPELMVTAQQRAFMYRQIRSFRNTKPIFTMDFWNDGEYAGGCIAGGRRYLHINANGDIEPCAFIHYSDSNISEKSLLEALRSPLFMLYRQCQPFNDNLLRPCPLLDNPGYLADMVKESGAKSTDMKSPENVDDLCTKTSPIAEKWAPLADNLWSEKSEQQISAAKKRVEKWNPKKVR
jgi:MoaA/NifB/PqqE/SkfB family radical SAM enzyme